MQVQTRYLDHEEQHHVRFFPLFLHLFVHHFEFLKRFLMSATQFQQFRQF